VQADIWKWGKKLMLIFHPDKVELHFKKENKLILEEFTKIILRYTKEDVTENLWKWIAKNIHDDMRRLKQYAEEYEDWIMQCFLLSSAQKDKFEAKREEELWKTSLWIYRKCKTLEQFTAVYLGKF
jgi:hypothetical protein